MLRAGDARRSCPQWPELVRVAYVMTAQALSGIAKDLTKMSCKSADQARRPRGCPIRASTGGSRAHRLQERTQGRRLLRRRRAARHLRLRRRAWRSSQPLLASALAGTLVTRCAGSRPVEEESQIPFPIFSNIAGRSIGLGGAHLPIRLPRRLVRRRPARLPVAPSSTGHSRRSAPSSRSGSSATASSRPRHRASSAGAPRMEPPSRPAAPQPSSPSSSPPFPPPSPSPSAPISTRRSSSSPA